MITQCAPGKDFKEGSCLSVNDLVNITQEYNIKKKKYNSKIVKDKRVLLDNVNNFMKESYNCKDNDQVCWIESNLIKDNMKEEINLIANETFLPLGPKGKRDWLSTSDIDRVLLQYENKFPSFKFFGAVPYDFDKLPQLEIYSVNFNDLVNKNKTEIGMVINLDTHDMDGSHWVALYANLVKNRIYFFDSFAKKPGKRLTKTIRKILNFMYNRTNNTNVTLNNYMCRIIKCKQYDIRYNKIQHQFKNSECGVYSINFIIRLLNGESFDEIESDIMKDDNMNNCRGTYFRNFKK